MNSKFRAATIAWIAVGLFSLHAHAADSFVARTLEDTKLYFTAPLRWDEEDWIYFGGALVAIGVAHSFDDRVRDQTTGICHACHSCRRGAGPIDRGARDADLPDDLLRLQ